MSNDSDKSVNRSTDAVEHHAETPERQRSSNETVRLRKELETARSTAQQERAERQRLKQAYQKSTAEARLLYEAGRLLGSTLDPIKIFDTVRELVSGIMTFDSLIVSSYHPETNTLSCSYAWIEGSRADVSDFPTVPLAPNGRGMQTTVIQTGKPLLIPDAFERAMASQTHYHVDPDGTVHEQPDSGKPQTRTILMVPIKLEDQVLGVVQLQSTQQGAYSEDDLRILEALVLQMAAATRNAVLYQQVREELVERKRTENALRESENQYRDLVETSNDLIWSIDPSGIILFVNQAAQQILGYRPEEMIGRPFMEFLLDESAWKDLLVGARLRRGQRLLRFEANCRRKDGGSTLLALNGVVRRDYRGRILRVSGTATDINERRRLEEQLLQSQKMEGIGRLAGGIAHDFNNLLTAIIGFAEVAEEECVLDSAGQKYLANIKLAAEKATNLTRQLLAFARRQVIAPKIVNLNELILNLDKMLRRLIGEHIELVMLPAEDLYFTKIDPGQFEQILVNLVVNARDAMPQGGKISIETHNVILDEEAALRHGDAVPGEYVQLTVSDTGSGMEDAVRLHIFEPFYTTKSKGRGTGLGLATVYGIVRQAGGYIWLDTGPGQGATFQIYLPRTTDAPEAAVAIRPIPDRPEGTETILLAEDEPLVRNIAVQTLRSLGYTVLEAANGREALRIMDRYTEQIHILVTDVVMPEMGGLELVEHLQVDHPKIPVLFLSGYTDGAVIQHGVTPDRAFLQKPFTPISLARTVREVLDWTANDTRR